MYVLCCAVRTVNSFASELATSNHVQISKRKRAEEKKKKKEHDCHYAVYWRRFQFGPQRCTLYVSSFLGWNQSVSDEWRIDSTFCIYDSKYGFGWLLIDLQVCGYAFEITKQLNWIV